MYLVLDALFRSVSRGNPRRFASSLGRIIVEFRCGRNVSLRVVAKQVSASYTFNFEVGTFAFTCRFHPDMNGTVTVT